MDDHQGHTDPAPAAAHNDARLVTMANQIATFFASQPTTEAPRAVAAHINDFWAPPMRQRLLEMMRDGGEGLRTEVIEAQALIRPPGAPARAVAGVQPGIPPTREGAEGPPADPAWPTNSEGSDAG